MPRQLSRADRVARLIEPDVVKPLQQKGMHACMVAAMTAIALLSFKGGVGKTTLALHLATAASDALIVDVDRQRSATGWWRSREVALPELVAGTAAEVGGAIKATERAWIFVDTAPAIDADARAVVEAVDFCLIQRGRRSSI